MDIILNNIIDKSYKLLEEKEEIKHFILSAIKREEKIENLGLLFEKSIEQIERKNKGQFYTPKEVVDYIISYLNIDSTQKIIDPSCGCGSFLISIIEYLNKKEKPNLNNIYGIDIDKNAVDITRISLLIKTNFEEENVKKIYKNIKVGNSILKDKKIDELAIEWNKEFSDVMEHGGFDLVIGNPPYVTLRKNEHYNSEESIYREVKNGPVNAATLMLRKSLEYIKQGGMLAFVLPKSILYVNSYSKLRKYILENTSIIHIVDLGLMFKDVRGEQIILILKKEKPIPDSIIEVKTFKSSTKSLNSQPSYYINQSDFKAFDNKILILENKEYYSILGKISKKGKKLSEVVEGNIFRGLPLNKKITDTAKDKLTYEKILSGRSISKFAIKKNYYINKIYLNKINSSTLIRNKSKKIIMQNIFSSESGVMAVYDEVGILTLDTVTNILVKEDRYGKYLLGLLHSKLINFFISFALFNGGRLTMHLDKTYIGDIPIIYEPCIEYEIIIKEVEKAMYNKTDIKQTLKEIDTRVYKIYDLSKKEVKIVESAMNRLLSKKSRW
jgi:type I restriction-modification system DNA methylase subunit